jgi:GAF domain-containing protein/anti-sigma regulatory factor (Ser/Thr protein kinase)
VVMPSEVSTAGADQHLGRVVDELKRELEAKSRELAEAREQQAATAEILRVISSAPTNLERVFAEIAAGAARLCDAYDAAIGQVDGNNLHLVAHHGPLPTPAMFPLTRGLAVGRAIHDRRTIHVTDLQAETDAFPESSELARRDGYRTLLTVPLIRAVDVIGAITIRRTEVRPFTDRQIELLQTFADQAVIAIENTRLFEAEQARTREVTARTRELTEALEQQTATADVLKVISRSALDLQRVLDALVESAARLCNAYDAAIFQVFGDGMRLVAYHGQIPLAGPVGQTFPLVRGHIVGRAVIDQRTIQVADTQAEADEYPESRRRALQLGYRTALAVPLVHAGNAIGVIYIRRSEVRPFTERQIELVNTFADQAVIAIENTRLFGEVQARTRELTEALEYQTATSEVLEVISRSQTNVQPVFGAILDAAVRLCKADQGGIARVKDGQIIHVEYNPSTPEVWAVLRQHYPRAVDTTSLLGRAILERRIVHVPDVEDLTAPISLSGVVKGLGFRSQLSVPFLRDGEPIGVMALQRQAPGPFSPAQIALVETFADQAVIAIENARLFEAEQTRTRELTERTQELTETLEYQTATSDVLGVISRSPSNLQPVLHAIVETAARLCQSDFADFRLLRDGVYEVAATTDDAAKHVRMLGNNPIVPGRGSITARAALERRTVHVRDIQADPEYTYVAGPDFPAMRTILGVPLVRDGVAIGVIVLFNSVVRPFTQKQIALVTTFADQALIAIENTRLFEEVQARNTELRVALEQQTATSELLKVIGRSTFELEPVFETLAENAVKLCSAERALVHRFDGQLLRVVATHNVSPELRAFVERNPITPDRHSIAGRAAFERRSVSIHDAQADPEFTYLGKDVEPVRTALSVPMLKADELLGVIMIYRHEVRPFSDNQIALMETFADQAAIAIENTRLFEQVQARNRDLTALGEVGRAVSSTLDLKVVLKTIVDRAVELSGTDGGSIFYYRQNIGRFELGETTGHNEDVIARYRQLDIAAGQTGLGEAIATRRPLQVSDILDRPSNPLRDAAIEAGFRAALIVPLLGGEEPLGALVLQRRQLGEFPQAVVSLMQSFADQSVIALENARLFDEIAQKSRELEIASQHKSQFVANMSHELRTPLAAMLGYAELLQEGIYGAPPEKFLPILTRIRSNGKHLLGLINTVLDISKIEAGQFKLNIAEYALGSIVETVMVATESLAAAKKLAFKTEVAKELPYGLGDEQRLCQVLLNLVGNAIKFTDAGEVRITAGAASGHFELSVSDTGPGIPPEERERIFEKFRQVDSSNTRAKGGTGLGLAIAREIIEMHGGRIWVESTLGQGSTFRMELPVRVAAAAGAA